MGRCSSRAPGSHHALILGHPADRGAAARVVANGANITFFLDRRKVRIVAGTKRDVTASYALLLRFLPGGTRDAGFGGTGIVKEATSRWPSSARAIILPDGKLLLATTTVTSPVDEDMVLLRYSPAGTLDPTFGAGGRLRIALSQGSDVPLAMAIQPDGKVLAAGRTWTPAHGTDLVLLRLQ